MINGVYGKMNRRTFINKALVWVLGFFSVAVLVEGTAVMYRFLMPFKKSKHLKTFTCFLNDLLPDQSKEIQLRGNKLILVNNKGAIDAFSATCTHLGCSVKWNKTSKIFLCPCHMAAFDRNGQVLNGPPPRPLDQYTVLVEGNSVFVFVPENYWAHKVL